MATSGISKLSLQFIHESKTHTVSLYDAAFASSSDVKKINVAGREYIYEDDAEAPECVKEVLKSLSEARPFAKKREFVSFVSHKTNIEQMSLTKTVYSVGANKLLKRTNADTNQLESAKNSLRQALIQRCTANDKSTILATINDADPFLNQPKIIFEIADQIEKQGNPELGSAIREAKRPFDLQSTMKRVPELIADHYLDKDKGKQIAEKLKAIFHSGKYDKFYDRMEFVNELTIDLREISQDGHVFIVDRQENIDFKPETNEMKVELKDDYTYFELTKFENIDGIEGNKCPKLQEVKQALDQIRKSNPKAIIIDLRRNSGGSLYMMAYIASHFIKPSIGLGQNTYRDVITQEELQTFPVAPVKTLSEEELPLQERMLEQPIFILTSNGSFSAAEALTYHLREHRKATVIGETTGGGAHVNKLFEVNDDFFIAVSFGDYVLKSGEKNWDGDGLAPDIQTNAKDALLEAEKQINS